VCKKCGYVFFSGYELRTPAEVVQEAGGRCPRCGERKVIDPVRLRIEVKRLRESFG